MKDMCDGIGAMEMAIREGDHDLLRKSVHTVKGLSGHLKSGRITHVAGEIERMITENNLKAVSERFFELKRCFADVERSAASLIK